MSPRSAKRRLLAALIGLGALWSVLVLSGAYMLVVAALGAIEADRVWPLDAVIGGALLVISRGVLRLFQVAWWAHRAKWLEAALRDAIDS